MLLTCVAMAMDRGYCKPLLPHNTSLTLNESQSIYSAMFYIRITFRNYDVCSFIGHTSKYLDPFMHEMYFCCPRFRGWSNERILPHSPCCKIFFYSFACVTTGDALYELTSERACKMIETMQSWPADWFLKWLQHTCLSFTVLQN